MARRGNREGVQFCRLYEAGGSNFGTAGFFVRFLGRGMGYNKINGIVYISVSML